MKIIHSSDRVVSSWTGGTTEELFIYPIDSLYAARDFGIRISTATIEIEESQFTSLPDFQRILMILEGAIQIVHEGQYEKQLKPFDQDHFSGAWSTKSIGKARDFNVIYRSEFQPLIETVFLQKNDSYLITSDKKHFIYLLKGKLMVEDKEINVRDAIVFDNESSTISTEHSSTFILVSW